MDLKRVTQSKAVDPSITPGDDFFGYANGAWLKAAVIPAGKDRWTVRDDINELTRRQVAAILLARDEGDDRGDGVDRNDGEVSVGIETHATPVSAADIGRQDETALLARRREGSVVTQGSQARPAFGLDLGR